MGAASLPVGRARKTVDPKGRVQLPVGQSRALGESVWVSPGFGTFLQAYSEERWEAYAARLAEILEWGPVELRDSLRHVLGQAVKATVDPQHRLVIPRELLDLADLPSADSADSRDVIVLGTGICVEIWNPDHLAEHEAATKPQLPAIWNSVSDLVRATPARPVAAPSADGTQ